MSRRKRDTLGGTLTRELERLKPDIVSNLNGRSVLYCYASAIARDLARSTCVGGDDLSTKAHVFQTRYAIRRNKAILNYSRRRGSVESADRMPH